MPELPEVETIRRQLEPLINGRHIVAAWAFGSAKFTPAHGAVGSTIQSVDRRGKYLIVALASHQELVIHLGMTGRLSTFNRSLNPELPTPEITHSHLRAWWLLHPPTTDDCAAYLLFHDTRRFGRLRIVPAGDYRTIPTLHNAGPEPLGQNISVEHFYRHIRESRVKIKTQLLSQRLVAGIGNIYADEALWFARIHPEATRISKKRAELLLGAIRRVLAQGIENRGTTLRDYRSVDGSTGTNQGALTAYGRAGQPCFRCTNTLVAAKIDGRSSTWCPHCQHR